MKFWECIGLAFDLWMAPSDLVRRRTLAMKLETMRLRAQTRRAVEESRRHWREIVNHWHVWN